MSVRVLMVRHGHHGEIGRVLSGRSEIALDAAGQAQAAALGERLAGGGVRALHSSPRRRTLETAQAIAARIGVPVQEAAALDEADFGTFAGRAFAELDGDPDWRRWNAERDGFRCPGGETMGEVVDRAERFVWSLAAGPVVVVTHCDVVRGVVARRLGIPFGRMFALPCDPGSLTELALENGALRLVTLNERPG